MLGYKEVHEITISSLIFECTLHIKNNKIDDNIMRDRKPLSLFERIEEE